MSTVQAIVGVIAGAIGAAVWAAVSYYMNLEVGYIAWGIGILVGAAIAASGKNTPVAGGVAVAITIVSILAGKYVAVDLAVQDWQAEIDAGTNLTAAEITDDDLIDSLANQIASAREEAGEEINWPEVSDEEENAEAYYPADIWQAAVAEFKGMSDEEKATAREEYVESTKQALEAFGDAMADAAREEGFMSSFGVMDLVFFGLAVATAWGIASRDEE